MTSKYDRKRCLLVTSRPPYPPTDGGNIRIFNILKYLANKYRLDLATFAPAEYDLSQLKALEQFFEKINTVRFKKSTIKNYWLIIKSFFNCRPINYSRYDQSEMNSLLQKIVVRSSFDIIFFSNIHTAQYAPLFSNVFKVVDIQNNDITILQRWANNQRNIFKKKIGFYQSSLVKKYLKKILPEFNLAITVSKKEEKEFKKLCPKVHFIVIENGVDLDYFTPDPVTQKIHSIIYTGDMSWLPNADACQYIIKEIFPLIQAKKTDVKLILAGRRPPASLLSIASNNIKVTDFVKDIRPYFNQSTVFIVPLRIGGGTRLKILEAMAMKIPIVSTRIGCEGLEVEDGKHLLIREDSLQFADEVLNLLYNKELRNHLVHQAYDLVRKKYDWNIILKKLVLKLDPLKPHLG